MKSVISVSEPSVKKWIGCYARELWPSHVSTLNDFILFLRNKPGFDSVTAGGLLEFQRKANVESREFELLDYLQEYILQKPGTYKSLRMRYSRVRIFFKRNRVPLPDDDFKVRCDREPNHGRLTVDVIKSLIDAADLGLRAFYLSLWMGIMDLERFRQFNERCGYELSKHLKEKGVDEPFLVEFPGRKASLNKTRFYTFLGRDALFAWREYFERIRGYPGEGESLIYGRFGSAASKMAFSQRHLRMLEKLNYIKRGGGSSSRRYGLNLHEFRDVARTLLHLQGKGEGLDFDCVEFWMGHVTDPNYYDKFYTDKVYVLKEYRLAEKYLNIISGVGLTPTGNIDELVEQLVLNGPACLKLVKAIEHHSGSRLVPVEK